MPKISKEYLHYMFQAFSSENEFNEFISYCQKPIKKSIKINLHKISVEDFVNDTEND
jgi:16S rRNA C967 or C1407 C5-methylase (RsmB/RsmF family)